MSIARSGSSSEDDPFDQKVISTMHNQGECVTSCLAGRAFRDISQACMYGPGSHAYPSNLLHPHVRGYLNRSAIMTCLPPVDDTSLNAMRRQLRTYSSEAQIVLAGNMCTVLAFCRQTL